MGVYSRRRQNAASLAPFTGGPGTGQIGIIGDYQKELKNISLLSIGIKEVQACHIPKKSQKNQ